MTYTNIIAVVASVGLILFMLYIALGKEKGRKGVWMFPAAISLLFLLYSIQTIVSEGPLGFWTIHTNSFWGAQIWTDLLIAIGIGWYVVAPRAKSRGMHTIPWIFVILGTGCIGFLAMVARLFYLEEKHTLQEAVV